VEDIEQLCILLLGKHRPYCIPEVISHRINWRLRQDVTWPLDYLPERPSKRIGTLCNLIMSSRDSGRRRCTVIPWLTTPDMIYNPSAQSWSTTAEHAMKHTPRRSSQRSRFRSPLEIIMRMNLTYSCNRRDRFFMAADVIEYNSHRQWTLFLTDYGLPCKAFGRWSMCTYLNRYISIWAVLF
jgi:hypothetical protein